MKAALALAVLLLLPAAAQAGQVTTNGTILTYTGDGQDDKISISRDIGDPTTVRVTRQTGGATITENSTDCSPVDDDHVVCSNGNTLTRVVADSGAGADVVELSDLGFPGELNLGAGDDTGNIVDQDRPFVIIIHAGDGTDRLFGGDQNDVLDGGGDSDFMQGRGGADDITGGGGFDFLDYYGEPARTGRVEVDTDDVADDGNPDVNEKDNVHSDVEDITGTTGNDVLIGGAASNILYGNEGNDRLVGGGGVDVLFGSYGDDTLEARDGLAERVDCAAGNDSAIIDDIDSKDGCEVVDSSAEEIPDRDGDGISKPADCNDLDEKIKPGAYDVPDDSIDQDCNGTDAIDLDRDRDGFNRPQDCDDTQAARHPGATDVPANGVDEDCDQADAPLPELKAGALFAAAPRKAKSRFTKLSLTGLQPGDDVQLSCSKKRCKSRRTSAKRPGELALARFLKKALARGTVVEIVVSRAGFVSVVFRLRVDRAGKAPKLTKLCQAPGEAAPRKCAA